MMIEAVRSAITGLNAEERDIIESELQTLCSNILENKIDAESWFISILFDMCLLPGTCLPLNKILMPAGRERSYLIFYGKVLRKSFCF